MTAAEHGTRVAVRPESIVTFSPLQALFREKDYVVYVIGNGVSLTGTWIQRITIAWLVWELTKSTLWVGIAALADLAATLFAGLLGGVLADRLDRLRFLLVLQLVSSAVTLALAVAYVAGLGSLPVLIGARFLMSACIAVVQPARMTLIPELVGVPNMAAAVSFGAVVFNLAKALGPALAGVLIAYGGFGVALLANALTYLVMAGAVAIIGRRRATPAAPRHSDRGMLGEVRRGYEYVANHSGYRRVFMLYLVFVTTLRALEDLLPALVELTFARGVAAVSMLTSLIGLGSIAGGVLATTRRLKGLSQVMLVAGMAYAGSLAAFVLAPTFALAGLLVACTGFFAVQFGSAGQALLQTSVEPAMRGRVMSLWFILMRGGPALGALLIGAMAEAIGLTPAFLVGCLLCLLAVGALWPRRHTLALSLERPHAETVR